MKDATQEMGRDSTVIRLPAVVDEHTDFSSLVRGVESSLIVECGHIKRINSAGARLWIRTFDSLRRHGVQLRFKHCAPVVLEWMSIIGGFVAEKEVDSIRVPFFCYSCKKFFEGLLNVEGLVKPRRLGGASCPTCSCALHLDDDPRPYSRWIRLGTSL